MMYRYLLVVRFGLVNVVALALLTAVYLQGWLDTVIESELSEFCLVIVAVFLYGLAACAGRVWITCTELNQVKAGRPSAGSDAGRYLAQAAGGGGHRDVSANILRLRLTHRIAIVRHVANSLVFLGLIGTVIGFIIALSGVDPTGASQSERVGGIVASLISGMSVALNTTLVGAVLYVWLIVNHRLLATGTVALLTATLEGGESDG